MMELNTQWRYTPIAKVKVCTFSTSDLISFTLFGKYLAKTICLNMMRRGMGVIVSKVEIFCRINYIWFNSTLSCCFANSNELSLMRVSAFLYLYIVIIVRVGLFSMSIVIVLWDIIEWDHELVVLIEWVHLIAYWVYIHYFVTECNYCSLSE